MIIEKLKSQRHHLGLTQQKLAELASVSLPTIQNMERNVGNPSLDVLTRVVGALGLVLSIEHVAIDWDALSYLGVPLTSSNSKKNLRIKRDLPTLLMKIRAALSACHAVSDRKMESLAATLLAMKTHWPSLFDQLGPLKNQADELIKKQDPGRLKLRSLAISNLQVYL